MYLSSRDGPHHLQFGTIGLLPMNRLIKHAEVTGSYGALKLLGSKGRGRGGSLEDLVTENVFDGNLKGKPPPNPPCKKIGPY